MSTTETRTALAAVQEFYAKIMNPETFGEAMAVIDDDVVMHSPPGLPYGGEFRGRDAFVGFMARLGEMVTPETIGELELIDAGDRVIAYADGKFTGNASGQSALTSICEVYSVRDGKIFDVDVFYKDPAAVAAVVPA